MYRFRYWLGNQLMALAIRLLCPESDSYSCWQCGAPSADFGGTRGLCAKCQFRAGYIPDPEVEDDGGQPMPAVELSEKAKAMVYRPPSISKPTIEIKPQPLPGSYADRVRRARGV
jgi:hypothetical protein